MEERDGGFFAYEFEWKADKKQPPKEFLKGYAGSRFEIVNRETYWEFVAGEEEDEE